MPNSKKGDGPNPNGGAAQGAREQAQAAGQQVQQGVEQAASRLREGLGSARETAEHGYRQAEGAIARNPAPSVLIGFGVGFGLGLQGAGVVDQDLAQDRQSVPARGGLQAPGLSVADRPGTRIHGWAAPIGSGRPVSLRTVRLRSVPGPASLD